MGQPLKAWIGIFASMFLFTACGGDSVFTGDVSVGGSGDSSAASLILVAEASELSATASDVDDGLVLTAIVRDANNNVVPGVSVSFSSSDSAGLVVPDPSETDSAGRVTVILTTGGDETPRTIVVEANAGELSAATQIQVVDMSPEASLATLTLQASSTVLDTDANEVADGIILTAIARDSNNRVIPGVAVEFTSQDSIEISAAASSVTDSQGRVQVTLTTGGDVSERVVTIEVAAGELEASIQVAVSDESVAAQVASISFSSSSPTLASDANDVEEGVTLTLVVRDDENNVLPGVSVNFSTNNAEIVAAEELVTDANGRAQAVLTTGGNATERTVTIEASAGGLVTSVQVKVVEVSPDAQVKTLSLSSSAPTLASDANDVEEGVVLTAIARDKDNNVIEGVTVVFSTTDSAEIVAPDPAVTDVNGRVSAVLTTGGDSTERAIIIQAIVGDLTAAATVNVEKPETALDSLVLLASSPTLSSDSSGVAAGITLTAIAKDKNQNVIPGETVLFSTSDSAEINVSNPALTDENGRATAILTTGGDQANRKINVRVQSQGLSDSVTVDVVGTAIDISGPTNTQIGTASEFIISLTDAAGEGIANRTIEVFTEPENTISSSTLDTDEFGQVAIEFVGSVAESSITAVGLGLTRSVSISVSPDDFTVGVRRLGQDEFIEGADGELPEVLVGQTYELVAQWLSSGEPVNGEIVGFGATRGEIAAPGEAAMSDGIATIELSSTEAGPSILTAYSDALTQPSAQFNVEFVASSPNSIDVQATPANVPRNQTSEIVAIVRDPDNNLVKNVTVEFLISDQTSGSLSAASAVTNSQGVARVTYTASSQASATEGVVVTARVRSEPSVVDDVTLTVGGAAAGIALGTGSEILSKDESTYELPFTIIVTDSAGNPAPDAEVSITLFAPRYFKGTFGDRFPCDSEDVNLNDILDVGEDTNNNGALEPGRRASIPASVDLDDAGSGQILVTYAKTDGLFVEVTIAATARVSGTEATEKRTFLLSVAEDDVDNLPGVSPFGTVLDCASPD